MKAFNNLDCIIYPKTNRYNPILLDVVVATDVPATSVIEYYVADV
jgi:hypothetical protein